MVPRILLQLIGIAVNSGNAAAGLVGGASPRLPLSASITASVHDLSGSGGGFLTARRAACIDCLVRSQEGINGDETAPLGRYLRRGPVAVDSMPLV